MLYATSTDNIHSVFQELTQQVETIFTKKQRITNDVASAHDNFAYPLGASLIQQEKPNAPTGEATTLDNAANAFQQHIQDAAKELDVLWRDWSCS